MTPRLPPALERIPRILLRPEEAARALGMSPAALNTFTQQGLIPSVKIGKLRRYSRPVLEAYFAKLSLVTQGATIKVVDQVNDRVTSGVGEYRPSVDHAA